MYSMLIKKVDCTKDSLCTVQQSPNVMTTRLRSSSFWESSFLRLEVQALTFDIYLFKSGPVVASSL